MKVFSVLFIIAFIFNTNIFSQVEFTTYTITTSADGAGSVYAVDVDGDGDMDVLSASDFDNKIAWYENDGEENFNSHTITDSLRRANSVYAVDVDGDGDIDVLAAASWTENLYYYGNVSWYENDGEENFTAHTIRASQQWGAESVYAVDVDGDSDIDILSAATWAEGTYIYGNVSWYENDGNENFTTHMITTNINAAHSVYAVDVDDDGDMDVLSASEWNKIRWYENDGNESFTSHIITTDADYPRSVYAIDLDGDDDIDVLSASGNDDKIAWYENDGNENFSPHTITTNADGAYSVYALDVDGDNDMDVLSASWYDDKIAWYENDGDENFTSHTITSGEDRASSVFAQDIDSDGDIDVLSASYGYDRIAWHENLNPVGIDDNIPPDTPVRFQLINNYPNPFNPTTTITYQIPDAGFVTLKVFDVLGNEVATLVNEEKPAGNYEVEFNPASGNLNLVSGIYFYQLKAGSFIQTKKMILLK